MLDTHQIWKSRLTMVPSLLAKVAVLVATTVCAPATAGFDDQVLIEGKVTRASKTWIGIERDGRIVRVPRSLLTKEVQAKPNEKVSLRLKWDDAMQLTELTPGGR